MDRLAAPFGRTVDDLGRSGEAIACVDGELSLAADATIPITDEGLLRGDGAFEVVRLYGGRPFALDEHLTRLRRSAAALRLAYSPEELERELESLLRSVGSRDGALRILVTRGGRRIGIVEKIATLPPTIALKTLEYRPIGVLRGVKSLSYVANMLLRRMAVEAGADDALLVSPDGEVLEAPTSAFFYVLDGCLYTPPLSCGILDSITRRHLLTVVGGSERAIRREELARCEEAFLASTLREVHPVHALDGVALRPTPGAVSQRATGLMRTHIETSLGG